MGQGRQKTILIITSIISLIAGAVMGSVAVSFFSTSYHTILKNELSKYDNGKALINIDNDTIGRNFFDNRVRLFKQYIAAKRTGNDPMMKDRLLRKIIDNYIVLKEAEKSKLFTGKKATDYLWLYLEEAMVNYYLDFMVDLKGRRKIKLSEKELNDFYLKNKEMFDRKKISREKAIEISKKQLETINKKMVDKNRSTARIVELGRLKKGKKIKINREYLKSQNEE